MAKISKDLVVPYTTQQMYELINAVDLYPEFLPWCSAVEVHTHTEDELAATIHLAKGPVKYSITTKNSMIPGNKIDMEYVAGPFKSCNGSWQFIDQAGNCQILFDMEYQFINRMKRLLIEPVFNPIANTLIDAFHKRAEQIYGN